MGSNLTREEALTLLKQYNKEPFHIRHALTVEGVMHWFAKEMGYGAAALMRPSKSVMDMEVSSIKKKFKDKKFAAGCSREVISTGAERLGWELNELFEKTLHAMQSCESEIEESMKENFPICSQLNYP